MTVGADHKDKLPLNLLANYLGGPAMNSRLSMNIREKYGDTTLKPDILRMLIAVFSIYFGTDSKFHRKVERLVNKELRIMFTKKMSTRQLHDLKKQIIGQIALSQDSGTAMMSGLAKSYLLYNRVEPLSEFFKAIEEITTEDILRVSNEFIHPKPKAT